MSDDSGTFAATDATAFTISGDQLTDGDVVGILGTASYNGGWTAFNTSASTFSINTAFVADETGTYSTGSLNQVDPRAWVAETNGIQPPSTISSSISFNGAGNQIVLTPVLTYFDLDMGSSGAALTANSQRWALTDPVAGIMQYQGLTPRFVTVSGVFSCAGGNSSISLLLTYADNTPADPAFVIFNLNSTSAALPRAVPFEFSFLAQPGDAIKLRTASQAGNSIPITCYGLKLSIR